MINGDAAGSGSVVKKAKRTPEEIVQELMSEFIEDTRERLGTMEQALNSLHAGKMSIDEATVVIKREAHNLKGIASTFDFDIVSQIMHRLEDYLDLAPLDTPQEWQDAQVYLDKSEAIINSGKQPNGKTVEAILSALPGYRRRDVGESVFSEVKVLLVTPSRTISKVVQKELLSYGFQVLTDKDPFVAMSSIVRLKPGLIIASEELDGLNGINLLRAVMAMTATESIPVLLLSSFDKDLLIDRGLPYDVPVIGLGSRLSDELAMSLTSLEYRWGSHQES